MQLHLVWIPKYRKQVLVGPVAIRVRDLIGQIAMEHELDIIAGQSGTQPRPRICQLPAASRHRYDRAVVAGDQLAGTPSGVLVAEEAVLGRRFWVRGCLAVRAGTLTDEMVAQYMEEQEGEPLHDDGQFPIGDG